MKLTRLFFLFLFLGLCLAACRDDSLLSGGYQSGDMLSRADLPANNSGLKLNADGTYTPTCRVPLVGDGRIINEVTKTLVSVLSTTNYLEYLVNDKLEDAVEFSNVVEVATGEPIVAVRDVNRVYGASETNPITAGFVYNVSDASLLSLDVLKGFWIKTYLKGEEVETSLSDGGSTTGLLKVSLLNTNGGNREVQIEATKPFDEVRFGNAGITVEALKGLKIYYAYVGNNPEKIAAAGHSYPNATASGVYGELLETHISSSSLKPLTDENTSNSYDIFSLLGQVATSINVDFGENIPAKSEVGFKASGFELLNLTLIPTLDLSLEVQNAEGNKLEDVTLKTGIDVSLLSGGYNNYSMITSQDCQKVQVHFPYGLKVLGNTKLYYAYMRDPVKVDVSSYFTIGNDTTANNYYDLPRAKHGGSVTYVIQEWPQGASPKLVSNRMTGMTVNGAYQVQAIYQKGDDVIYQQATIYRNRIEASDGCNVAMVNTTENPQQYTAEAVKGGALLNIFVSDGEKDKLVNADLTDYAQCVPLLNLIEARGLVAIQSSQKINETGQDIRTGFVMQTSGQLLGADVLKFFFIRLYNGNNKVYESLTAQNDAVQVGLVGNDASKLRFSVETDKTFDRIELWSAGLLNVSLNALNLYYAFYESADCDNSASTAEACLEMITAQKDGADINYEETQLPEGIDVGSSFSKLGNLLDNSAETSALIVNGVSVLSRSTVAVKFDEMPANQTVGAIVKKTTGLASIDLLKDVKLVAYYDGTPVGNTSTGGSVGDIDLIGSGDNFYLELVPSAPYNEIRISFPKVTGVLDFIRLAGFYKRVDSDGDGTPDCAEDPDQSTSNIVVDKWTQHICADAQTKTATIRIDVSGAKEGEQVKFTCYSMSGSGNTVEQSATVKEAEGQQYFELQLPVGDYSISGLPENGLRAQVHPLQTTWKRNAPGTDWNDWNNWTDGSPWGCTDVVIPAQAARYPELQDWRDVDDFWGGNFCNQIHFEPGAEVVNTHYLQYEKAYVEMQITGGAFHAVCVPLHGMVTGDMFVSSTLPEYFTPLNSVTYPEVRHNPVVRQQMWSRAVNYATSTSSDGVWAAEANWSRTFNAVSQPYDDAQGIMLQVGETNSSYRLRFPKDYTSYNYYTLGGTWVRKEDLSSDARKESGHFVYEGSNFDPSTAGTRFSFTLRNESSSSTIFVAGNPFMTHIDIQAFLEGNSGVVSSVGVDDCVYTLENGKLVSVPESSVTTIRPMQAFYVYGATSNQMSLTTNYTEQMLKQEPSAAKTRALRASSALQPGMLSVTAHAGDAVSGCLLIRDAAASDAVVTGEDVPMLIDKETMPAVSVYSIAGQRALTIQKATGRQAVKLGFVTKGSQRTTLEFRYAKDWDGWTLNDSKTGRKYVLDGTELTLDVTDLTSGNGRFYLEKTN